MSKAKYRAAIVGCGDIARRAHVPAYAQHELVELVAIADTDPAALRKFADTFSIPAECCYPDHLTLFREQKLDVVSVCTWHGSHAEISIAAAEAGISGILCEKPMATSVGEGREMLKAAKGNGAKLTVEHTRRYDPLSVKGRELIAAGKIGQPQLVTARTRAGILNWSTHLIDQIRYILGDPETEWVIGQIERQTDRYERLEPVEDLAAGLICFSGGVRFLLESDLCGPEPTYGRNAPLVIGSAGRLSLEANKVTLLNADGWQEFAAGGEEKSRTGLVAHLDELFDWMEGKRTDHRCSGAQAFYDLEIMMAIYESARTRGLVKMPLATRANPLKEMLRAGALSASKPGRYDIRTKYWE